ncbi:D-alanine--D-alanine ligase family protein [Marinicellulosiphila megalodicopiae]|uniref:D-alanine--D-alanine ligase family protein n=1 Tax=Marinicellulosiphila megalodicopiae TaxID=2724896 RepID=UPI003BAE6408
MKTTSVAIICGGPSAEHEVSLRSALNIAKAIDASLFTIIIIAINKTGQWFHVENINQLEICAQKGEIGTDFNQVSMLPQGPGSPLLNLVTQHPLTIDVFFPILHGPFGEDGAIQGLAKFCHIPCVGPGILGSSIGMDKDVFKMILRQNNIPVSPSITVHKHNLINFDVSEIKHLGLPVYVKPCNMGSSVGVSKVKTIDELNAALVNAFQYDQKVLIEQQVIGRELEIAILGNNDIQTSTIGEVLPQTDFYSYESKYLDQTSQTQIPAKLNEKQIALIKEIAVRTYQSCQLSGLTRVDVFLTDDDQIIVNEVNTLPGFTNISMYPQLWEHAGLSPRNLMSKLIELAFEQFTATQVSTDCMNLTTNISKT